MLGREESTNFPDILPLQIANEASIGELNSRLRENILKSQLRDSDQMLSFVEPRRSQVSRMTKLRRLGARIHGRLCGY